MKENAYLLNCRNALVYAVKFVGVDTNETRKALYQALAELDYYRHGQLQKCDNCADIKEEVKGP